MNGPSMHRRHRRQRGQVVPIIALFSLLLIAASALAVDLSLNTHARRTLQNATDAAALAAAQDLPTAVAQADRQQAALDAVLTLDSQLGQPVPSAASVKATITSAAGNACTTGTACHVTLTVGAYTATIDTPPVTASNAAYDSNGYVEVNLSQISQNAFGKAVGYGTSTERGHSIAYHFASNQGFGFALYANTVVQSGNQGEIVSGNVYANQQVQPQSGGLAGFCASNGGYIIFGAPQTTTQGQSQVLPKKADVVQAAADCSGLGGGSVIQTALSPTTCGNQLVSGTTMATTYNRLIDACVANPDIAPPTSAFEQPTLPPNTVSNSSSNPSCGAIISAGTIQPGYYSCANGTSLNVTGVLAPGVYVIIRQNSNGCSPKSCYDIDFSGVTVNAPGVTIVLQNGASMGVEKGANVTINPTISCTQTVPSDCRYPIYAGAGSNSAVWVTNLSTTLSVYGTLYLVNGSMNSDSNPTFAIPAGQAIVDTWNVQSGNHTNPDVTYNGGFVAPQLEQLRLVE
jgi:Flp pilus assembly protein TadG